MIVRADIIDSVFKNLKIKPKEKKYMTRVRYIDNVETGGLRTANPLLAAGGMVNISINRLDDQFIFSIVSIDTNDVMASGSAEDVNQCKKLAKLALKDLGVVFHEEVRRR